MQFSRRTLFASSPALLIAATSTPAHSASKPEPSALRPITEAENSALLHHMHAYVSDIVYEAWFSTLRFESIDQRTINVTVRDDRLRNWVSAHYLYDLTAACRRVFGEDFDSFAVAHRQSAPDLPPGMRP